MIKLIAADMDGTLIGKNRDIPKENIEAIKAAQKNGIKFAIATGRAFSDVEPFIHKYDLQCDCVVLNGAEYRDINGDIVEHTYIEKKRAIEILEVMKCTDLAIEIYTDDGFYTTNTKEETLAGMVKRSLTFHPELKDEEEILKYANNNPHFKNMQYITDMNEFLNRHNNIAKFVSFAQSEEIINKLRKKMEALEGLAVSASFETNIEVNHMDAEKGKILAKVAQKLNIKKDEVVVLGDGLNDYSMFTEFKNSFAMGNAVDEIKEVAKYITDINVNFGVAKAIYRILNGEL
ncbi:Cof-type HAD-IIB family hydrolase [Clostridium beijerinckii]|uniref:Cof-type HAD-IIB family hydrolase n=1 Tax=Clostridium beijerinckii TaxID=1520 RepID=UPI000809CCEA|nr:Cof-type HAD-IIB family hydrolase [Clostridium beijerinckii]OCA96469.1 haloacid dehalogenase [Clostridium beijerinckii]